MHVGKHSCNIGCICQTRIKGILKTKGVEVELELLGLQGMGQQNDVRIIPESTREQLHQLAFEHANPRVVLPPALP